MDEKKLEKLGKYLKNKTLDELATMRALVFSIMTDYDKNLATYANLNGDTEFRRMPKEVADQHERRNKMHGLLMQINRIIEEKLFSLYE